ncbi:hypothetical protein VCHA53O466_50029 [Vibrio chagasii]|nr:hypothetical protein VCHA53O466_50029 [Vibrio chagasii]
MLKNYIVPYVARTCDVDNLGSNVSAVAIDGYGVLVRHGNLIPSESLIKRHLIGVQCKQILIQAADLEDCLSKFNEIKGADTGTHEKAISISTSAQSPITEYLGCEHMGKQMNCRYFDDETTDPESHLQCILNGCDDVHDECPIKMQMNSLSSITKDMDVWVKRFIVGSPEASDDNWEQIESKDFFIAFNAQRDSLEVSHEDKEWIDFKVVVWRDKNTGKDTFKAVEQLRYDETEDEYWQSRYFKQKN